MRCLHNARWSGACFKNPLLPMQSSFQVYLASQCSTGPLQPALYKVGAPLLWAAHGPGSRSWLGEGARQPNGGRRWRATSAWIVVRHAGTPRCRETRTALCGKFWCLSLPVQLSLFTAHRRLPPASLHMLQAGQLASNLGVEAGPQMTVECAVVKLMLCLAHPDLPLGVPIAGEL